MAPEGWLEVVWRGMHKISGGGTCGCLLHEVQLLPEGGQLGVLLPHRQRDEVQQRHLPVRGFGVQELRGHTRCYGV